MWLTYGLGLQKAAEILTAPPLNACSRAPAPNVQLDLESSRISLLTNSSPLRIRFATETPSFDNLFGAWAFQQLATTAQPLVSGQGAQPGEVVKLEAGGEVHLSVADSKGNYVFRAAKIPVGSAQLFLQGKAPTTVQVAALVGPKDGYHR